MQLQYNLMNQIFLKMNDSESKYIIHIGFPKTATTWFQTELYPKLSNRQYIKHRDFRRIFTEEFPFQYEYRENIVSENFGCEPLLVCDETIIGNNPFVVIESLNRIKQAFPNCKIVLFIRNQLDSIVSKYSQYVFKGFGTESANKFVTIDPHWQRITNFQKFQPEHLCYDKIITHLYKLFGKENVFLYLFEDFVKNPRGFVAGYLAEHNLVVDTEIKFTPKNEGLRKGLYPVVRFFNIFTKYKRRDKYYLIHIPFWMQFCKKFYKWLNSFRIFGGPPEIRNILNKKNLLALEDLYKESNQHLIPIFGREKLMRYKYPI